MTADTVGGVWTYAVELALALQRHGIEVHIATMGAPLDPGQRSEANGLTLHESRYRLEWMQDCWDDVAAASHWLLHLERAIDPDVVHLNQFAFGAVPFRAPKVVVAHSCVLSWWQAVHGVEAPRAWDRYRDAVVAGLRGAQLVVAPTHDMLRSLATNYAVGVDGIVIPNGRDAARYRPARKERSILAAGRLWDAAKNIEALEAIAPDLPWPVRLAGSTLHPDGGVRASRSVQSLGALSTAALSAELARAAVYAAPARYEPFGLSALEAALCGCALVLGDIASLREVWADTALFVAPDDHEGLRATLTQLCTDDALRVRVAARCRAHALRYTPERMALTYRDAYASLEPGGRPERRRVGARSGAHACAW